MALVIGDQFSYQARKPLDSRLVASNLASLLAINEATVYNGIQVYVESEKQFYVFNSSNTVDAVTGKWREFNPGSSKIEGTLKYSKAFTKNVNDNEVIAFTDISGVTAITDIKTNQFINDAAGIIGKVVSIDSTNNEITINIMSKDTVINTEIVKYNNTLDPELNKVQTIDFTDLDISATETIVDFDTNRLVYDIEGTIAKVLSKDETAGTLNVVPVTVDIAISANDIYVIDTLQELDPTINKQQTFPFSWISGGTTKLITDIETKQLVYDKNGTLAKIDSVDITGNTISVTVITATKDKSVEVYKYLGVNGLNKISGTLNVCAYTDIDTTKLLSHIRAGELVYDNDGTLGKITNIDIPGSAINVQTLTASGMTYAPLLKELVIKDGGKNYAVGEIIESSTSGVFAEITDVGANGEIISVNNTTATASTTTNKSATVDYDTVIYGAFGKNWSPLSNSSASVTQIISEPFEYEAGYTYEIVNSGSGYKVGDIVSDTTGTMEVTKVNTTGAVEELKYSRQTVSTLGVGLAVNRTTSNDVFIIPDIVWNNAKRTSFELTNDDGASVEFNRLDGVTERCAAGVGSIYKFTFDSLNGVIYQEKTEISGSNGGIGPFIPLKNYKKDDVIINDNIIYICKQDHTADSSLGADIAYWTEMRKQMTSGMRSVKTQIISQTSSSTLRATKADYVDGDASMYDETNCKYIAPVDGLYLMQVDGYSLPNNNTQRRETAIFKDILNWDNAASISSGVINLGVSVFYVGYLKAGESLIPGHYSVTSGTVDVTAHKAYITFVLLTDDRSDNLVAEADLIMPVSISARTYKTLTYENTSNIGIISTNGAITLPEDGSYMLSIDNLISGTGGTSGGLETILTTKGGTAVDALTTITHASCTKLQSAGFTHIITGSKGDTFEIKTYRTEAQSNLTKSYDQKIRLFKIKSVDYHIDSHDLYKDSGSTETYEDWVASKMKQDQLTVTARMSLLTPTTTKFYVLPLTYVSGEMTMLDNNEFVAPISGFYYIQMPGIGIKSSSSYSDSIICVNNKLSDLWDGAVASASSSNRDAISSISTIQWLSKGDRVCLKTRNFEKYQLNTRGSDLATFTLINSGMTSMNQYTADKPHLWPDNQEVDLGDGLYGYKAVGVITAGANAEKDTIIPITEDITLVNWNSWFKHSNSSNFWLSGSVGSYSCALFKADKVYYRTKTSSARTNFPYTVWLTYTKGGTN